MAFPGFPSRDALWQIVIAAMAIGYFAAFFLTLRFALARLFY
jgi:hypothetical protein